MVKSFARKRTPPIWNNKSYAKLGFRLLVRTNCFICLPYFHARFMFDISMKVNWFIQFSVRNKSQWKAYSQSLALGKHIYLCEFPYNRAFFDRIYTSNSCLYSFWIFGNASWHSKLGRLATPIAKQWAKNSGALARYLVLRQGKNCSAKDRKSSGTTEISPVSRKLRTWPNSWSRMLPHEALRSPAVRWNK